MNNYIIYKPYGMLSQFTKEIDTHITLADLSFQFPKDVYPVGRLDADSEGLLILSNNKQLNQTLLTPSNKQEKTYWVQVEGEPTDKDLQPLRNGMELKIKKQTFTTQPATVQLLPDEVEQSLPKRVPPIRVRKNKPTTWVEIKITEGKNRQVRKMFATIGFPVLRLVRVGIAGYQFGLGVLQHMKVGETRKIDIEH